jgi:hypothetical protein
LEAFPQRLEHGKLVFVQQPHLPAKDVPFPHKEFQAGKPTSRISAKNPFDVIGTFSFCLQTRHVRSCHKALGQQGKNN